jgi:phage gpG-like protein
VSVVGLQVEVSVGNDSGEGALQRFAVAVERAGAELANLSEHVFPRLVPVFEQVVAQQFAAEGEGPIAGSWAELSPSYAEWKEQHFPGLPILERTGALKAALTQTAAPQAHREWTSTQFVFGTAGIEYASFHQGGTSRMKARPPFDFGPDFERLLTLAAMAGVRDAVRKGSGGALEVEGEA